VNVIAKRVEIDQKHVDYENIQDVPKKKLTECCGSHQILTKIECYGATFSHGHDMINDKVFVRDGQKFNKLQILTAKIASSKYW